MGVNGFSFHTDVIYFYFEETNCEVEKENKRDISLNHLSRTRVIPRSYIFTSSNIKTFFNLSAVKIENKFRKKNSQSFVLCCPRSPLCLNLTNVSQIKFNNIFLTSDSSELSFLLCLQHQQKIRGAGKRGDFL